MILRSGTNGSPFSILQIDVSSQNNLLASVVLTGVDRLCKAEKVSGSADLNGAILIFNRSFNGCYGNFTKVRCLIADSSLRRNSCDSYILTIVVAMLLLTV